MDDQLDQAKKTVLNIAKGDDGCSRLIATIVEPADLLASYALEKFNQEPEANLDAVERCLVDLIDYHKQLRHIAAEWILRNRFEIPEAEASELLTEIASCLETPSTEDGGRQDEAV